MLREGDVVAFPAVERREHTRSANDRARADPCPHALDADRAGHRRVPRQRQDRRAQRCLRATGSGSPAPGQSSTTGRERTKSAACDARGARPRRRRSAASIAWNPGYALDASNRR